MGVARSVPVVVPDGRNRNLHPAQLQETPIFEEIKAKGQMTKQLRKEAFLTSNIKYVLIAIVVLIGQGGLAQRSVLGAVLPAAVSKVDAQLSLHRGTALFLTPSLIFLDGCPTRSVASQ
jgi:hypothetical protein